MKHAKHTINPVRRYMDYLRWRWLLILVAIYGLCCSCRARGQEIKSQEGYTVIGFPLMSSVQTSTNNVDWSVAVPAGPVDDETNYCSNYVLVEQQTNDAKFWRVSVTNVTETPGFAKP